MQRRSFWRRWSGILGRMVAAFLLFSICFPLGYALLFRETRGPGMVLPMPEAGAYSVYVVDWGYHTGIVIEQARGWALGPPRQDSAPFLEYAWGDRSFYLHADYRPHILFATVVLPTASVLYLGAYGNPPQFTGARAVFRRTVDAATLRVLATTLERSIPRSEDGRRVQEYSRVPWFAGLFYPAYDKYLWPRDCNWWTVARLAEAGLARGATGVIFSGQVSGRLLGFVRVEVAGPR